MPTLIVNGDQDRDNGDPAALTSATSWFGRLVRTDGVHWACAVALAVNRGSAERLLALEADDEVVLRTQ